MRHQLTGATSGLRLCLLGLVLLGLTQCARGERARSPSQPPEQGPEGVDDPAAPEQDLPSEPPEVGALPVLRFARDASRPLIFVNNPEQLFDEDLAESGVALYATRVTGPLRVYFSHVNMGAPGLRYSVRVSGTGRLKVAHRACVAELDGAKAIVDAYATPSAQSFDASGGSKTVLACPAIPERRFFSGFMEAEAEGELRLEFVAHRVALSASQKLVARNFVRRIEANGSNTARVYNGVASESEVRAQRLHWAVDDSVADGPLRVTTRRFDLARLELEARPEAARAWRLHIGPGMEPDAVTEDMVDFAVPGLGLLSVRRPASGSFPWPNFGNWGVFYELPVRIRNLGSRARTVAWRFQMPASGSVNLAWRLGPEQAWQQQRFAASSIAELGRFVVAAGRTQDAVLRWNLGGPSNGALRQSVWLLE